MCNHFPYIPSYNGLGTVPSAEFVDIGLWKIAEEIFLKGFRGENFSCLHKISEVNTPFYPRELYALQIDTGAVYRVGDTTTVGASSS